MFQKNAVEIVHPYFCTLIGSKLGKINAMPNTEKKNTWG